MSVADLAALECQHLADRGIEAVLTGGAVVTIYSENEYRSDDLDFICTARQKDLTKAMVALGFKPDKGRYFVHRHAGRLRWSRRVMQSTGITSSAGHAAKVV